MLSAMRTLPAGFQDFLNRSATTLCYCWLITRQDGIRLGFTDHDKLLAFDGQTYSPASGLSRTALNFRLGLRVDNVDVEGRLR